MPPARNALKPGGDIHTITQIWPRKTTSPTCMPAPKKNAPRGRSWNVHNQERFLNCQRTFHCIDSAWKLDEYTVTSAVRDPPTVLGNQGINDPSALWQTA